MMPNISNLELSPSAEHWNQSGVNLNDMKMDSNFFWHLCSLVSAMAWVIYITYYNSRVFGYFVTRLLNRFVTDGYLCVGSLTCNVLSGKIMFRDIVYITHDYSMRVQDGWLIFRWWRSYVPKDVSEDLSHSDTRLSLLLNGFELHVYNRLSVYAELERLFGLDSQLFPKDEEDSSSGDQRKDGSSGSSGDRESLSATLREPARAMPRQAAALGHSWRDLIPVIKLDVCTGRVVFGNRLVPTTLSINVEEAHFVYSTKPAASRLDPFMHFVKCRAENFKVILAPSLKYTGMVDDPPRYMGEGFVVLSSNNVELYYYMDEPGVVPEEPEMLQLANGDIVESAPPIWGIDIKCGKGTDFSYGPWADRQREHLFKFFFPNNYQPLQVTKPPQPGEKRQAQSFDIRLSTLNEATIDVLFSKNKETNAVHINVGPGSYLEITIPWVVTPTGYVTKVTGQLLHLEASTSLQYRSLVDSETLEFTVKCHYPIKWNDHQEWILNLTGCKATVNLIYAHKWFFQDLVNDWSSKARPDLLHFVPYTWKISLLLKEFEIITLCNEYNWIDCSSHNQENTHIAFCGDLFDLSFDLPFNDFLPNTVSLRFWMQGESVDLAFYLPDTSTSRCVLLGLDANAKVLGRNGNILQRTEPVRKWRNRCQRSDGWVDCWAVPIVALCINYTYHPAPPLGPPPQADITTPEKEEILLSPMRIPRCRKSPGLQWSQEGASRFDPTTLAPDEVSLELEIGPSVLFLYGSLLRNFMHLKENIFGEDQMFTDMQQSRTPTQSPAAGGDGTATGGGSTSDPSGVGDDSVDSKPREFDPRQYRPIEVRVSITMHDIQGHLMKSCGVGDPPCPSILLERFGFEMKKGYRETQLQLLLSPAVLLTSDSVGRPGRDRHLAQGHLMLSGLQVRGHAMFSDEGRSLDQETLEYGWLVEAQLGKLSGKLTAPQLHHLITSLETLLLLCKDSENGLRGPRLPRVCHHGVPPAQCAESEPDNRFLCPSGDEIKYRMTRAAVDCVDLYLLENGTAVQLWASPIRLSTCNLHGVRVKSGVTAVLPAVRVRQLIASGAGFGANHSSSNTTGSGRSQHSVHYGSELWLEVGSASLGPLLLEAALSLPSKEAHTLQHKYLRMHDEATHRLWFLSTASGDSKSNRCGCVGGCAFFGTNRNGPRFFRPSPQDLQDGINVAAFRVHEAGRDPGFGQSILHDGQLVFHTPPYDSQDVSLQEPVVLQAPTSATLKVPVPDRMSGESPGSGRERWKGDRDSSAEGNSSSRISTASPSPAGGQGDRRGLGRRFSYTAAGGRGSTGGPDVPYARLVEHSPTGLAPKLDSDSRLDAGRGAALCAPTADAPPKSSASDSRLALDYFQTASAPDQTGCLINQVHTVYTCTLADLQGVTTCPPAAIFVEPEPEAVVTDDAQLDGLETEKILNVHFYTGDSSSIGPGSAGPNTASPAGRRESQQSLATGPVGPDAEELLRQEVQRTISMSSENHSEAFYSADEDVASQQASRASSLRHSATLGRQESSGIGPAASRKKFRSELSIAAGTGPQATAVAAVGPPGPAGEGRVRLSSHRSDHEIHTPEHRHQGLGRPDPGAEEDKRSVGGVSLIGHPGTNTASRYYTCEIGMGLHDVTEGPDGGLLDSSDSQSVSSTSFISAVSSQEDLTLVNLHMQVNKPIVDSPLLMSSYISHLSQLSCSNWSQSSLPRGCDAFTVPLFQRTEDGKLVYIGSRYTPRFDMHSEGFTSLKMVDRISEGVTSPPPPSSRTPTHPYVWENSDLGTDETDDLDQSTEEELLGATAEGCSRTVVILKMKGDVDIMLSPLVLESLQRFIDAITPTLASLHPLTVLNHLHAGCISEVEAANVLKRDHAYLAQLQASSKRSTAERGAPVAGAPEKTLQSGVYEEKISTQIQGTISLPKVNITLLQASVVEEVISFSALDNIRDLTCVSLFAVCFEGITTRFHIGKQAREVVQTFQRPAVLPGSYKKVSKMSKVFLLGHQVSAAGADALSGEPVYIETSEKQQEETVVTLGISKIHAQLRRLKNESSILKDAVITAIPAHYSRVLFTCAKVSSPLRDGDFYTRHVAPPAPPPSLQTVPESSSEAPRPPLPPVSSELSAGSEDSLGFIMFESGLEGVSVKVVKRSLFDKGENCDESKTAAADADTTYTDTVHSREDPDATDKHLQDTSTGTGQGETGNPTQSSSTIGKGSKNPANSSNVNTSLGSSGTATTTATLVPGATSATVSTAGPNHSTNTTSTLTPGESGVNITASATTATAGGTSTAAAGETTGAASEEPAETPSAVTAPTAEGNSNASSCVIEFRTVWFNFAAPPRAPITRKIDFTRLDWNLLSTASPAINAWMNPSNRFALRLVHMIRSLYRRQTGIVASLMAEALDVQSIHVPSKSRYGRYTPISKTLQEDPSCQLCSVLQKYVLQSDLSAIEANLAESDLPNLSTLRQGVIVLSRQWKNVLYTPLLLEHNYKTKHLKPLNVKFALPTELDEENLLTDGEGEGSGEECEVTDECAMLLTAEGSSHKGSLRPHDKGGYGPLREERTAPPHVQLGSNPSIYSGAHGSHHSGGSLDNNLSPSGGTGHPSEDLYSWMAKQDFTTHHAREREHWESKLNTLTTEDTLEEPELLLPSSAGCSLYPLQDSLRLLDAHLIFEPLLSSLGVAVGSVGGPAGSSSDMPSSLEPWGSNLSLVGGIDTMRIDIVVSEYGKTMDKKKSKVAGPNKVSKHPSNSGPGQSSRFHLDIPPETAAFLCEKIGVELDLRQQGDMTVDELVHKQNILYISRGQLKKHSSTVINVALNIRFISQQVNMPLLRLLHQISNMYQNVKDTQIELKEQQQESKQDSGQLDLGRKNNSSSTSDLQEIAVKISGPTAELGPGIMRPHKISPSSSLRSRPQSFAQKLRSTSKSVKGYMNLNEGVTTPMFAVSPSGSGLEQVPLSVEKSKDLLGSSPRCWKTIYYLLELYASMPETKTIAHRFSVAPDVSEGYKGSRKYDVLSEGKASDDLEKGPEATRTTPVPQERMRDLGVVSGERTRLVVFGVARIHRTRLLATLSGLKLEAEITSLHASLTCRKKSRPASLECSLTGQVGRTMIVLLEGVAPSQQTVVRVTVGKSQALYSSLTRRSKDKNSGLLTVGAVNVDIPQHPVALHGMMTRGSKQLSNTLQELRVTRTASRLSRGATVDETDIGTQHSPRHASTASAAQPSAGSARSKPESSLLQPLVMQFSIVLQSLSITAALLPSLQAQYKMDQVTSTGVTGSKAKFTIDLQRHSLSFTTKLQVTEANLPSEASIELPKVHVSAEYVQDGSNPREAQYADGVVLRQGSYLSAVADIGIFEHSLTTDLLNHLVFVQKVFMKEVNEVVQKVYGGEKPVPLWMEGSEESTTSSLKRILFSLVIRIKRIQLTATTPTNSAVRLETGAVELQLSNRVQNVSGGAQPNPYMKLFGKAQVDVNLSLGQLLKNVMFEEAEPEFQQYAFFKTRIGLRNAFQDEMVQGEDKEVVLITLRRPLMYIQPMAVDKAILVWLNYKNAYEYWNEQRSSLNKEVLTATQQVFEKVPFGQLTSQLSSPHLGTLFLQLTVDDMGICLPLNPVPPAGWGRSRQLYEAESRGAVVVTLESTSISACSSGSLVSKGRFVGLCLRFADDFETSLDDWKPDMSDSTIMNLCVVSEGTYEVCSRTIAQKQGTDNAKWLLNVQWQMEGVDIHLDVNVGKQLSALGHTLTTLTGSQEDEEPARTDYDSDDADQPDGTTASLESISTRRSRNFTDSLPAFVFDPNLDAKKRSKLIEKEMNEQAKIINDLRSLGASHGTIEQEMRRLQELEAMVFKDFRRDMIQKLRRQSVKASSIKGKFGLGSKASTYRSRSFIVPSPTPEHHLEMESPDDGGGASVNSNGNSASFESSPRAGPSRSASLRVRGLTGPRVTFSDTQNMCRQSSLPSAGSDLSLPEGDVEWGAHHIDIEGERVELRRRPPPPSSVVAEPPTPSASPPESTAGGGGGGREAGGGGGCSPAAHQKPQEPNIDFELDVKVLINSGKCVLHTKDPNKEDELKLTSRMRKERSCSGGMFDFPPASPNSTRRSKEGKHSASSTASRLRYLHGTVAQLVDLTIFHIPGLDVKVHYESHTLQEDVAGLSPPTARKSGTKKASLFAWMTLQSIPEETIISPHILEYLEQTLEPIPSSFQQAKNSGAGVNAMFTMDQESTWAAATASANYAYASFPVDVIVYFHMQPSTFRFSCLPVSRVECMLQLPSLDIVFSSKRAEEELSSEFGEGVSHRWDTGPSPSAVGGLSVTGCLADFSVYIFHPYGGGKKSGLKEAQWSPLADSERKDSLSVNVEFVKFHISRSRKLNFPCDQPMKGLKNADQSQAVIRFSTIVDIGSASFKYDMRRLTEILAFPKAWYRRSIVRRLFLGDLSISAAYSEGEESPPSSPEEDLASGRPSAADVGRHSEGLGLSRSAPQNERSPMLSTRERLRLSLENDIARHVLAKGRRASGKSDTPSPSDQKITSAWETLVLFAINFTKLNVHMNMGNVMGNVMWLTKDFKSEGRLSIGSNGHKNMYIGVGLGGSGLDAKGGIVGGAIELSKIDTYIHIREDPGTEPDHTVGLKLFALELRLDYMGTGVLMSRVSSLAVSLRDEWKITRSKASDGFMPTRRPAMIFLHGDLGWDQLQLMISKSTTADLLKMFYKLDEFFSQQFKSSKRVFSSLQPRAHGRPGSMRRGRGGHARRRPAPPAPVPSEPKLESSSSTAAWDARHHRHWQCVLAQVCGLQLSTLSFPLPRSGTVLGGTMELHGNNISLACFHGINFKAKSWALFSLKEPCISFATEAQEVPCAEAPEHLDVHVVQTLTFSLGMTTDQAHAQHHSMATVCRLSRNVLFPPQFRTLQEWFHYAFSCSDIDAVDRFPSLERERERVEAGAESQRARSSSSSKLQEHNHTREVIFALPSLQLHVKTEHLQAARTPDGVGHKPLVECSFITEFEDHIFVTVDAEAFFFLHDLITSYVKERERVSGMRAHSPDHERRPAASAAGASDDEKKRKPFDPGEMFTKDWRNFQCKTWHLEPTVRLLSWGGKSIEPYGVDYILQKLGFAHARTTIPKWMQRGFMDPLDKVLAVLMLRMIIAVREEPSRNEQEERK